MNVPFYVMVLFIAYLIEVGSWMEFLPFFWTQMKKETPFFQLHEKIYVTNPRLFGLNAYLVHICSFYIFTGFLKR